MRNHKISFLLFKRHAMKRRVAPLCLFLRQLVSLFPDRTAVLNSSWDLLSSIPKITTIKNSFIDWEALAAFIVPKQKWMFALKQTVPFLTSLQRRLRGFNKMSAVIPACETHPEGNIPLVNFFHALSQGRASNVMIYPLAQTTSFPGSLILPPPEGPPPGGGKMRDPGNEVVA